MSNHLAILLSATLTAFTAAPLAAQERVTLPLTHLDDVKTAREPDQLAPASHLVPPAEPQDDWTTERHSRREAPVAISAGRHVDRSVVHWDAPGDGALWARGASYKARFDASGVTYHPSLGSHAPRTFEIPLSPSQVSIGGQVLRIARSTPATRTGDRAELDRGAFSEVYALTPGSLEQTFVFDTLPRTGELVVRIPLGSDMEACATSEGLEFQSDFGRVTYSNAIAFDARGKKLEVPAQIDDGSIVIRVDAAFVAQAALPLVIDPIVTTFPIVTGGLAQFTPDAAYDATNARWLVTFVEAYSATDYDVYAQLLDDTGALVTGGYVDYTTTTWFYARCANLAVAQQFLVVATTTSAGVSSIKGRTVQAASLVMGSQVPISNGETGNLVNPDVGGDPYFGQAYYCVVYQREVSATDDDIVVRLIDSTGASAVGPVYLANSTSTQDVFPSISKSNGSSSWAIAWERDVNNVSTGIWAGRINWNGAISASPFQIINYPFAYLPSVSSPLIGSTRNAIVYEAIVGGSSADTTDVFLDVITGGAHTWWLDVSGSEFSSVEERVQVEPRVDSDGQHFSVMYSELVPGTAANYNVYVTDVGMSGTNAFVTASRTPLAASASTEHIGRIVAARSSGGGPALRYLAVWQTEAATSDVYAALYDGREGGKTFGFCFGGVGTTPPCPCGNNGGIGRGCASSENASGAGMYASGSLSTVHDTTVLNVNGLPLTTACLFFQAAAPLQPPVTFGDGILCISGSILRLGVEFASGGTATHPGPGDLPLSVAGGIPIDGTGVYYQCWYRDAAVFCTSSTFNLTSAVQISWGR